LKRLNQARRKLEQALSLTALSQVIPQAVRNELTVMRDDLDRIFTGLEKALTRECFPRRFQADVWD
jgi:hypothetical protein